MIPRAAVTHWRGTAPWPTDAQVEQDLVLSRALVEMFSRSLVAKTLAFRGGTALHKLFFEQPLRYSEDIDLVQLEAEPIGPVSVDIRAALDPWLGVPNWKASHGRFVLMYRFETTALPVQRMRLKVEINTREHLSVLGKHSRRFSVESPWFSGAADLGTYKIEELLGTKLRALYQRKKGRDLYDLWQALTTIEINDEKTVECFVKYTEQEGTRVSRAEFEANLSAKVEAPDFAADVAPLLASPAIYDARTAAALVHRRLVTKLRGDPWKGKGAESSPWR